MLDPGFATRVAVLTQPDAIGASLGLLGDEWTLLIVRGAFEGARRYADWKTQLPISDAVLTARLRTLVDADVLHRRTDGYALAPAGLDLWPLLLNIWDWERRHVAGQAERLPRMVHTACGDAFHPVLCCAHCGQAAGADDVDARFGPGGSFERSAPVGSNRRRPTGGAATTGPGMFSDTMAIIGNRWSSAVLGAAFLGATRFRDFEQIGAPPATVADRLRRFVELGVFEPSGGVDGEPPAYRLTAKGRGFFPAVAAFLAWGERWRPAPEGATVVATHRACNGAFVPRLACSECTGELELSVVHIE